MIGQTISHYRILEKLGEGGMGVVYKAQDTKLNRLVALKFLPQRIEANSEESARLLQEARAAARLNHPNIATIFDFDAVEDATAHTTHTFIAMEYVEGESLKSVIRRGHLSVERVQSIAMQLAHALFVAHAKGIVHRDLKPANIMIATDGTVKVLDFGVAKLMGETTISRSGDVIGTIAYMSPEQIQGGTVDARSDIWAFGVTIFEMLTQRLPFQGEHTPALMYSINNQEPLSLKELRPDAPDELAALCARCLQKDPCNRYPSITDVLSALGVTGPLPVTRAATWHRQSTAMRVGFVALIVLIVALMFSQLEWRWGGSSKPSPPTAGVNKQLTILPFQIDSGLNEIYDWPTLIQRFLSLELAGNGSYAVREPFGLNVSMGSRLAGFDPRRDEELYRRVRDDGASLVIDGMITKIGTEYLIRTVIVDLETMDTKFQDTVFVQIRQDLLRAIERISKKVLIYLMSNKHTELKPWLAGGTLNLDALRAFQRSSEYNFKGQAGAEKFNRRALELDSTFISPRIWLLTGLVNKRKLEEAKQHYQILLSFQPKANPFLQEMIDWSGAKITGDSAAQVRHLENALEYSSGDNLLLMAIGSLRSKLGDNTGALEALLEVSRSKWQNSLFAFELARCYMNLKRYPEAAATLDSSLSIKPVYHQIYGLKAILALIEKDTAAALRFEKQCCDQARFLERTLDRAYADLAGLYRSQGFVDEAIRCYRSAVSMNPKTPQYYDELAEVLYSKGNITEAISNYLLALRVDKSWINAHWTVGRIFESSRNTTKAREHYTAFLKQDSTSATALGIKQRLAQLVR